MCSLCEEETLPKLAEEKLPPVVVTDNDDDEDDVVTQLKELSLVRRTVISHPYSRLIPPTKISPIYRRGLKKYKTDLF